MDPYLVPTEPALVVPSKPALVAALETAAAASAAAAKVTHVACTGRHMSHLMSIADALDMMGDGHGDMSLAVFTLAKQKRVGAKTGVH